MGVRIILETKSAQPYPQYPLIFLISSGIWRIIGLNLYLEPTGFTR